MAVSTYNNTRRNGLRYVLKRRTILSVFAVICIHFKSLAEASPEEHNNLRSHSTSDPKKNEEKSLSDEINKCDMKKYTAEEINEMINSSNEFINRNDMNIIFSYVHESEREKFKKVEENIFKFIQSIVETYKIPDEYKMRKFKFAHFEMQGYALKQEKFLLEYAFLSLNGKLCERKKFKEVLEYVKREWIEFRKSMFDVWKEKLASEFREHGEMLNQKRKLKQHELDRRAQREKMLEEHSRGIFAKGYLGEVESETIKKKTEHHENVNEDNVEKPKLQQHKVQPPKVQQQKVQPPKSQQQKVQPPTTTKSSTTKITTTKSSTTKITTTKSSTTKSTTTKSSTTKSAKTKTSKSKRTKASISQSKG
ncbi:hypothetical protein PFMC_02643 [Plasmodium falciparum CAMP/Malaysia]|uniref:Plasmodium RESA N-terminal domain-containing protein n=1 Tax=Plasmodium falciparum (isolate Camp / Malaysia) TaxID=5835 RepID=A0A024X7N2_PLAFC|nr:hypothetical protein PFMC_02643 [Plasmodium falciparum CAMP/Malaysia]